MWQSEKIEQCWQYLTLHALFLSFTLKEYDYPYIFVILNKIRKGCVHIDRSAIYMIPVFFAFKTIGLVKNMRRARSLICP